MSTVYPEPPGGSLNPVVLSLVTHLVIIGATLSVICRASDMTGGQAGFILGFAETMVFQLIHAMEMLRAFDTYGVGLERLAEYQNLEVEDIDSLVAPKPEHQELENQLESWPIDGRIEVSGLSARYAPDLPDILHDVTFSCSGGQRVGIVGATGGGKSTLAKSLFRFVEISNGTIRIDGLGQCSVCGHTPPKLIAKIPRLYRWTSFAIGWVSSPRTPSC